MSTATQSIQDRIVAKARSYNSVPHFVAVTVQSGETPPRYITASVCDEDCVLVRGEKIVNGSKVTVIYVVAPIGFWGI